MGDAASTSGKAALPGLNLQVDYLGDGVSFTTLVFEPYLNPDHGAIVSSLWQTWDAYKTGTGKWWSTRNLAGSVFWRNFMRAIVSAFVAAFPNEEIIAGVGITQGRSNAGLYSAVDGFTVSVSGSRRTYNFELGPQSIDECKKGGWAKFGYFRNQGDCVSFVVSSRS